VASQPIWKVEIDLVGDLDKIGDVNGECVVDFVVGARSMMMELTIAGAVYIYYL